MQKKGHREKGEERKRGKGRMGNGKGWRAEEDEGGRVKTEERGDKRAEKEGINQRRLSSRNML